MAEEKEGGTLTLNFNLKTLAIILLFITGIGGGAFSLGSFGLRSQDIPTNETVNAATSQLVEELRLVRRDMRDLKMIRLDVEAQQNQIDTLLIKQLELTKNQEKGFKVIWEQNKMVLERLGLMDENGTKALQRHYIENH